MNFVSHKPRERREILLGTRVDRMNTKEIADADLLDLLLERLGQSIGTTERPGFELTWIPGGSSMHRSKPRADEMQRIYRAVHAKEDHLLRDHAFVLAWSTNSEPIAQRGAIPDDLELSVKHFERLIVTEPPPERTSDVY